MAQCVGADEGGVPASRARTVEIYDADGHLSPRWVMSACVRPLAVTQPVAQAMRSSALLWHR